MAQSPHRLKNGQLGEHIIAGSEPIEQAMQFGPVLSAARVAFLVDALAASGVKGLDLSGSILIFRFGDACIAEHGS